MITYKGSGLVNSTINNLPFELHLPGYKFCGPGTRLQERLERGDSPKNQLDEACREHDIAYSKNRENLVARHLADKILKDKAWSRAQDSSASFGESCCSCGYRNHEDKKIRWCRSQEKPQKS